MPVRDLAKSLSTKQWKAGSTPSSSIPHGRLQMASGEADGHPLLVVMSENVPEPHLEMLRKNNVSWIATGKERIDLHRATDILSEQFDVKRLIIVGGGNINGGFLLKPDSSMKSACCWLRVLTPQRGQTALFDGCTWKSEAPYHLKLQSVERIAGTETVWIRYRCK